MMPQGRSYGRMNPEMEAVVAGIVSGQHIFDFGAGSCHLAMRLLELGAAHVTAIDKEFPDLKKKPEGLTMVKGYLVHQTLPPVIDVGFVSWPSNNPVEGLVRALERCKRVIYLGCNDGATMCGYHDFVPYMLTRELSHYVHTKTQRMVCVGAPLPDVQPRQPTEDEEENLKGWRGEPCTLALL